MIAARFIASHMHNWTKTCFIVIHSEQQSEIKLKCSSKTYLIFLLLLLCHETRFKISSMLYFYLAGKTCSFFLISIWYVFYLKPLQHHLFLFTFASSYAIIFVSLFFTDRVFFFTLPFVSPSCGFHSLLLLDSNEVKRLSIALSVLVTENNFSFSKFTTKGSLLLPNKKNCLNLQ